MNTPRNILAHLRELDDSERLLSQLPKEAPQSLDLSKKIALLGTQIPATVLEYHKNRRARGKKSVAAVRHGVCGACHLAIPVGSAAALRALDQIHVCDHCGAFIYLAEEAASTPVQDFAAPVKRVLKPRAKPAKRGPKELQTA